MHRCFAKAVLVAFIAAFIATAPTDVRAAHDPIGHCGCITEANATTDGLIGGFIGALLGELIGKQVLRRSAQRELAAEDELRRRRQTTTDESNLKQIATALEEYSVDNGGKFPASLDKLEPPYLNMTPYIPGSDPPVKYIYDNPALNPKYGTWDLRDNGAFDPTLDNLRNITNDHLCTKQTCTFIIYIENGGLYGMPCGSESGLHFDPEYMMLY